MHLLNLGLHLRSICLHLSPLGLLSLNDIVALVQRLLVQHVLLSYLTLKCFCPLELVSDSTKLLLALVEAS